jgi:GLPGLI family protein
MKKNIIKFSFIIAYFIFSNICLGQTGIIKYEMYFPNVSQPRMENATLIFNDSLSLFRFRTISKSNKVKGNPNNKVNISLGSKDSIGNYVYRNYSKEKIIFRNRSSKFFKAKIVNDDWISIDWKIKNKFKAIGKYKCQMGVGDFRGRTYTAWFTEEIPLPYGPWKLFGLPGLIIEVKDKSGEFQIKMVSIKYPASIKDKDFNISYDGDIISIKEYAQFLKEIPKIRERKINAMLGRSSNPRKFKSKSNFIEKIFEWEEEKK